MIENKISAQLKKISEKSSKSQESFDQYKALVLERLNDVSQRVRKKAVEIVCHILEISDSFNLEDFKIIARKEDLEKILPYLIEFLTKRDLYINQKVKNQIKAK